MTAPDSWKVPAISTGPAAAGNPAAYPNLAGKHAWAAAISPREHAEYVRTHAGAADLAHLRGAVLVYRDSLFARATSWPRACLRTGWVAGDLLLVTRTGRHVGICGEFGIGAPAAAMLTEQLAALGVRHIITVGTAGGLQPHLTAGDIVICDRAIRDEGVSHHYLQPQKYIGPSPRLSQRLARGVDRAGLTCVRGTSWSIDAPYRETLTEIQQYRRDGVLTVEMEAAGVFAVAHYRAIQAAAAFVLSDLVSGPRQPRSDSHIVTRSLDAVLDAAVAALLDQQPSGSGTESP